MVLPCGHGNVIHSVAARICGRVGPQRHEGVLKESAVEDITEQKCDSSQYEDQHDSEVTRFYL